MRHAKSNWDRADLDDHDRPLAARGLRDAPRMGQRLAAMGLQPGLLLTSTARRARQTAELVRPAWAEAPRLQTDTRLYLASPGDMLAVIAVQDDAVDSLLVVGHNPGLTRLCNSLVPELALLNLPTAGAVSILCDTATWSAIDAAGFSLAFYDYPKSRAAQAI